MVSALTSITNNHTPSSCFQPHPLQQQMSSLNDTSLSKTGSINISNKNFLPNSSLLKNIKQEHNDDNEGDVTPSSSSLSSPSTIKTPNSSETIVEAPLSSLSPQPNINNNNNEISKTTTAQLQMSSSSSATLINE
jgi:hypothetical protein